MKCEKEANERIERKTKRDHRGVSARRHTHCHMQENKVSERFQFDDITNYVRRRDLRCAVQCAIQFTVIVMRWRFHRDYYYRYVPGIFFNVSRKVTTCKRIKNENELENFNEITLQQSYRIISFCIAFFYKIVKHGKLYVSIYNSTFMDIN